MRRLYALVLCLPACDAVDAPSVCEPLVTARKLATNGQSLNGESLNGQSLNGQSLNGESLNGQSLNGVNLNGMSLNGQSLNGQSLNGSTIQGSTLQGTMLMGVDADGAIVDLGDPTGATLPGITAEGEIVELRIDAMERNLEREDIVYYALSVEGENICGFGGRGLFVEGRWDATAARHDGDDFAVTFSCTTGVIAKCVEWGYTPYGVGPDAHQACTRLARADYCGDGVSYTRDGTEIDVFDGLGVMRPVDDPEMDFEAGWGPDGAVCVHAPRFTMVLPDGDELLPSCWDALPQCASEAIAKQHGALLANRSEGELRTVCAP